jgi:hypothetical protein
MITIGQYRLNGVQQRRRLLRQNRGEETEVPGHRKSEALAVGFDDLDSRFDSPESSTGPSNRLVRAHRTGRDPCRSGCGKDIEKVVSYMRQVAGVSSISRQEPTEP